MNYQTLFKLHCVKMFVVVCVGAFMYSVALREPGSGCGCMVRLTSYGLVPTLSAVGF